MRTSVNIGRTGNYTNSSKSPRRRASFIWDYHLDRPSYILPLLLVNREARAVTLAANPNSIRILQGPQAKFGTVHIIHFNAAQNILHFDWSALHALESARFDRIPNDNTGDPFGAQLVGFENIRNISLPHDGNFTLLRELRDIAPNINNVPPLPILNGVTYVEYQPALPLTINTCQVYMNRVVAEIAAFKASVNMHNWLQRRVVDAQQRREIGPTRILAFPPILGGLLKNTMAFPPTWAASAAQFPARKGRGVRAPRAPGY